MTKQTAVEWLFLMLNNPNKDQKFANKLLKQALAMEKEQIMNAWVIGLFSEGKTTSEEYYNQTFNK